MEEIKNTLLDLKQRLNRLLPNLQDSSPEIRFLESETLKTDFWEDPQNASKTMQKLTQLQEREKKISEVENQLNDGFAMASLIEENSSQYSTKDLEELKILTRTITKTINTLELEIFLSEKFDKSDAILSIHAGQGGTEAQDWTAMLSRMYQRYFELKVWKYEVTDISPGDEAGYKSITIYVYAPYAYGYLKKESGTHRLVRKSPFNADNLRQTSFANVEVMPQIEENSEIVIKDDDIEFSAFRSGGHGGQNVNKVSSAVRIKHLPTGIVVTSQNERDQGQNRKIAMAQLRAKLWILEEEKRKLGLKEIKGDYKPASWGNQIRNYVLHPYQLVKDLRSGFETSQTQSVLDGELDQIIEAELKMP